MGRFWIPRVTLDKNGNLSTWQGELGDTLEDIRIANAYSLYYAFYNCQNITGKVSFPNLTEIGYNGLYYSFRNCTGITEVSFPKLTTIGQNGMVYAFMNCSSLKTINFPSLTTINSAGFSGTFDNCQELTGSISFPSLTTVFSNGLTSDTFSSRKITELHFRTDAKNIITSLAGYDYNFGATNATIYFDL